MTKHNYNPPVFDNFAYGMDSPYCRKNTLFATRLEVADALGVRPETVSRWTSAGIIPAIKVGRLVRYDLAAIAKHLADTKKTKLKGGKK